MPRLLSSAVICRCVSTEAINPRTSPTVLTFGAERFALVGRLLQICDAQRMSF